MNLGKFSINDTIYFRANTVNANGSALDATSGPTYSVYADASSNAITTGSMSKVGTKTGFYEGSFSASSSSYSVGQHFILIEASVDSQTPKAHVSFQLLSDTLSVEETYGNVKTIKDSVPLIGGGSVSVDHNYGGTDKLRVVSGGTPVSAVNVRAFVKSDYSNGLRANKHVVGQTVTISNGRWKSVIRLDPGTYTLEFTRPGQYKTSTTNITVT